MSNGIFYIGMAPRSVALLAVYLGLFAYAPAGASAKLVLRGQAVGSAWKEREHYASEASGDDTQSGRADVSNPHSSEGGSKKDNKWEKTTAGWLSFFFAAVFASLIGLCPIVLALYEPHGMTKTALIESILVYIWLCGGLYLFSNVLWFQSPHFGGEIRRLSLEEAVYLFSQIITTVGYGDITPAKARGQVFVGLFVFTSIMLIANMISRLNAIVLTMMEKVLHVDLDGDEVCDETGAPEATVVEEPPEVKLIKAKKPLTYACCSFCFFVAVGTVFYHFFPGEEKTWGQGLYMSLITLSSVGFGAFTPVTHGGMVFGAFWMLCGVASLGAVVTSYTAWSVALKRYELHLEREKEAREGKSPEM